MRYNAFVWETWYRSSCRSKQNLLTIYRTVQQDSSAFPFAKMNCGELKLSQWCWNKSITSCKILGTSTCAVNLPWTLVKFVVSHIPASHALIGKMKRREGFHGESNVYVLVWVHVREGTSTCFMDVFCPSIFLPSDEWGWRQTKKCRENAMFDMDGLMLQSFPCLKTLYINCSRLQSILHVEWYRVYRCKQWAIASNATQIASWISLTHALERCCSSRWRSKVKLGENHMRMLSYESSCPLTQMYFET